MDHPPDTLGAGRQAQMTRFVDRSAAWAMELVADVLILLALIALGWVTVTLAIDLVDALFGQAGSDAVSKVVLDVLTVFIFLEIFHSFLDFLRTKTVEIGDLADITLAIIFREVWVGLFSMKLEWQSLAAIALLIVAVALVRTLAGGRALSLGRRRSPPETGAADPPEA